MKCNSPLLKALQILLLLLMFSCGGKTDRVRFEPDLNSLDLLQGDIALCGPENGEFGTVAFSLSCSENVRADFNLATALLHSFEYTEAEKVFAKVINQDPTCVMGYWGAAMCNFHPLWEAPSEKDLRKGSRIIARARSLIRDTSTRESDYLEAIATIYDQWEEIDHRTRILKFENASAKIFKKYPEDSEAAIFYSLALRTAADPADKTFSKQRMAGEILNGIFLKEPDHPGIAHYIIHTFDYPELAELALPAARKYASIAAASAHAQHMPSHIFTRLGIWEEAIQSNMRSVSAAQCYAENVGMEGHWDEELHGMDYLLYALLQKGDDDNAKERIEYVRTIKDVFPESFKVAYAFAAMPARYTLERRDWAEALKLELSPSDFPWEKFPWEKANVSFARLLGAVHSGKLVVARSELKALQRIRQKLDGPDEKYKANLVNIQTKICESWIKLYEGEKADALILMNAAADMEDATEKHPVTPGELIPARELLGDMYLKTGEPVKALAAYRANLKRHPHRFNGLYGAGLAAERSGDIKEAIRYYRQLVANASNSNRRELIQVKAFLKRHG